MSHKQGNLGGLVRLRSVREQDSRIGLATALREEREVAAKEADLQQLLANLPMPTTVDLAAFQGRQHTVEMIRRTLADTRATLETAHHVSAAARDRSESSASPRSSASTTSDSRRASHAPRASAASA